MVSEWLAVDVFRNSSLFFVRAFRIGSDSKDGTGLLFKNGWVWPTVLSLPTCLVSVDEDRVQLFLDLPKDAYNAFARYVALPERE